MQRVRGLISCLILLACILFPGRVFSVELGSFTLTEFTYEDVGDGKVKITAIKAVTSTPGAIWGECYAMLDCQIAFAGSSAPYGYGSDSILVRPMGMNLSNIVSILNSSVGRIFPKSANEMCLTYYTKDKNSRSSGPLGGACSNFIPPTPPPAKCQFNLNNLILDHGSLGKSSIPGHVKTDALTLTCNRSVKVTLNLTGSNKQKGKVDLGGGVSSQFELDGTPVTAQGVSYNVAENRPTLVNIKSILHTVGAIKEGTLSGSGVLVINVN